jgi:phospholipase/carboxylesterase
VSTLVHRERPADGEPDGLLVLHHGRGADEHDLLALADVLDPRRRLHVVTPRAPLQLAGWPGHHWYVVRRVGFPERESFQGSYALLGAFHDELWRRTGVPPERTVLGGFSMGAVMSCALALGGDRPAPAGILAMSGFLPTVDGWQASFEDRRALAALIAHGSRDAVIGVEFGRAARDALAAAGLAVDYREFSGGHEVAPALLPTMRAWLDERLPEAEGKRG